MPTHTPANNNVPDWDAFSAYFLVDRGRAPATVEARLRRVRYMGRHGLSWPVFCSSAAAADAEGRRWLAWKVRGGSRWAVAEYQKTLNWIAEFLAVERPEFRAVHWRLVKQPATHPKVMRPRDIRAALDYRGEHEFVTKRRRALIWIAYQTGLRTSEVAALELQDLDPHRGPTGALQVRRPAKGGRRRWIPLHADAWSPKRPLQAWLAVRPSSSPALWISMSGARMTAAGLGRDMVHISRGLGFPVSFNRFRATRLTGLSQLGAVTPVLQYQAGHAKESSTAYYIGVGFDDVAREMQRVGAPGFIRRATRDDSSPDDVLLLV